MAIPSEVRRVQAAIDNNNRKELEWSLWYARMRQSVASARPADVKYWSAVERQVDEILNPPAPAKVYGTRKKKKENRGLGMGPLPGEADREVLEPAASRSDPVTDPTFKSATLDQQRDLIASFSRTIKRPPKTS
jgi:hypothetical protein